MITRSDVAKLLGRAAIHDSRTTGKADVEGWFEIAEANNWTYPVVYRIIVEYYSSGAGKPRVDVAHITDRLRALRSAAASGYQEPREPDDLPDREYPKWHRAQLNAYIERRMAEWVATGREPEVIEIERGPGRLAIENAPKGVQPHVRHWDQMGMLPEKREKVDRRWRQTRISTGTAEQRARARAELEAKRAETGEQEAS